MNDETPTRAEELARKMCCCATIEEKDGAPPPWHCGHQLPYARALIEAEKALAEAALNLRLAAACIKRDETRAAANVNADVADAALASLRSLLEKGK